LYLELCSLILHIKEAWKKKDGGQNQLRRTEPRSGIKNPNAGRASGIRRMKGSNNKKGSGDEGGARGIGGRSPKKRLDFLARLSDLEEYAGPPMGEGRGVGRNQTRRIDLNTGSGKGYDSVPWGNLEKGTGDCRNVLGEKEIMTRQKNAIFANRRKLGLQFLMKTHIEPRAREA